MSSSSPNSSQDMPLWGHLSELRIRLFRVLVLLFVLTAVCFSFSEWLVLFLEQPLLNILPKSERSLYFTGLTDKFIVYFKVSLLAGFCIALPYILTEFWKFISPGLYQSERTVLLLFVLGGTLTFLAGITFCYTIVLPYSYDFLIHFGSDQDKAMITLKEYFGTTLKLLLGVGLVFEFPLVIVFLGYTGVLKSKMIERFRKHAIILLMILTAIITPSPDAMTMLIVAVPLWLLFELSVMIVKWIEKHVPDRGFAQASSTD